MNRTSVTQIGRAALTDHVRRSLAVTSIDPHLTEQHLAESTHRSAAE